MDPAVKEKWVAALRSGEYAQGNNRLAYRTINGEMRFCCLGVLCELAVADGVEVRVSRSEPFPGSNTYDGRISFPPDSVVAWAGLDSDSPSTYVAEGDDYKDEDDDYKDEDGLVNLVSLNDRDVPFSKIADIIEREL